MTTRRTISAGPWIGLDEVQALLKRAVGEKITKALGLEKALLWRTPNR